MPPLSININDWVKLAVYKPTDNPTNIQLPDTIQNYTWIRGYVFVPSGFAISVGLRFNGDVNNNYQTINEEVAGNPGTITVNNDTGLNYLPIQAAANYCRASFLLNRISDTIHVVCRSYSYEYGIASPEDHRKVGAWASANDVSSAILYSGPLPGTFINGTIIHIEGLQ